MGSMEGEVKVTKAVGGLVVDEAEEVVPEEVLDFPEGMVVGCKWKQQHIFHRHPCEELPQFRPTTVHYCTNFQLVASQ